MSGATGLVIVLPAGEADPPCWLRIAEGAVAERGEGSDWPAIEPAVLVAPAEAVVLHWIDLPDLSAPQGRAAARLMALENSIGPVRGLLAVAAEPFVGDASAVQAHCIAVVARSDLAQWLAWAQAQGLDPVAIVPAPLVLPQVAEATAIGTVGRQDVLRGAAVGLAATAPLAARIAPAAPVRVEPDWAAILSAPPLNLRQGEFAPRRAAWWDRAQVRRTALWLAGAALVTVTIGLVDIARQRAEERRLDAETLSLARQVLPAANDPALVEAELGGRLATRRVEGHAFGERAAALLGALQSSPTLSLASLGRDFDGTVRARLVAPRAADVAPLVSALRAAGFVVDAANLPGQAGRAQVDVGVRP